MSDSYRRFVSSLKDEVATRIYKGPPRLAALAAANDPTTRPRRWWVWIAAAVVMVAVGGGTIPIISNVQTRRLINEANRSFLDEVFDRSLFESSGSIELESWEWFDAIQITGGLEI